MTGAQQSLAFAALAALMVGAVFWLQPGQTGQVAAGPRAPGLGPALPQALDVVSRAETARVEAQVAATATEHAASRKAATGVASTLESPQGRARVDLLVLGLDGHPVAGRSVRVEGPRLEGPSVRQTEDSDALVLAGLHPGEWTFTTWPEGDELTRGGIEGSFERRFEFQSTAREVLAPGDVRAVVLGARSPDSTRLHGQLRRAGLGVRGRLVLDHVAGGAARTTETDADGWFDLALEPPGSWRLEARRSAASVLVREPSEDERARGVIEAALTEVREGTALVRTLDVAAGADVRLDLELPTGSIAGTVLGPDGSPDDALVELWPVDGAPTGALARVQVRGPLSRFEFQDVGPGRWELRIGDPEFAALSAFSPGLRVAGQAVELALEPGETLERTLQLSPAGHRVGRVRDAVGNGVAGALILVWHAASPGEPRLAGFSIEDGRFWTPSLLSGELTLIAFTDELASHPLELRHFVDGESEAAGGLDLRLGPGAFLRIEGAQSRPSLRDGDGREFSALAREDEHGWTCGPLPPGLWRVDCARPDGSRVEDEVLLAAGERRSLRP